MNEYVACMLVVPVACWALPSTNQVDFTMAIKAVPAIEGGEQE